MGNSPRDLFIDTGGEQSPCLTGLPRPDVAASFKTESALLSGWVCRVPVADNTRSIELIEMNNGPRRHVEFVDVSSAEPELLDGKKSLYSQWLAAEPKLFWPLGVIPARMAELRRKPLISVILPTHNPPLFYLYRCILSVTSQLYPHWELCVTDDGSSDPKVLSYLKQLQAADSRIRVHFRPRSGGISAASNDSLRVAKGEYAVLLDHDDELHPFALIELARKLNEHPDTDLIYSDEDKIDDEGLRSEPAFKPQFDLTVFQSFNYLGHIVCARVERLHHAGGFRSECDGAQDWDLLFRVVEASQPQRIQHIPKVLYHWRRHPQSTAMTLDSKPYAVRAWDRVLLDHLNRTGKDARVTPGLFHGSMRVQPHYNPDTHINIVLRARDGAQQLRAIRRSRLLRDTSLFEVFLSAVRPRDLSEGLPLLTMADFSPGVTIFLNCSLDSVNHGFCAELAKLALQRDCGLVGGVALDVNCKVLSAGLACHQDGRFFNPFKHATFNSSGYMAQARVVRKVPHVSSHFFATRTEILKECVTLAEITEDTLSVVCDSLARYSHEHNLAILFTPYAIASLRSSDQDSPGPISVISPSLLRINPNIDFSPDPARLYREGLA